MVHELNKGGVIIMNTPDGGISLSVDMMEDFNKSTYSTSRSEVAQKKSIYLIS